MGFWSARLRPSGQEVELREEELATIEDELAPARSNVGALVQTEVSEIDMALGKAGERLRQIDRVLSALDLGKNLTEKITALEIEIAPLRDRVDAMIDSIDFGLPHLRLKMG